ncbi:PREDICTED: uncharacterized protein LOC106750488 [Dinoponera quadriceps]|uniref:Uncharacterized protein LOC106750488 n=1 Tax=Dinoponera quadriceps TaxID=609295 RepID=A0A6P3Y8M2_DINQU|nr:PREDICTED: uncharacterized protein LOC106750488 [Dinoponera quadriceps]
MNKEGRFSSQELQHYRERLIKQKEFLSDILSKIEKQIIALQVERLHLRNTLLGTDLKQSMDENLLSDSLEKNNSVKVEPGTSDINSQDLNDQQLDLSVPASINHFEEEIEDDETSEDEKMILKKFDFINY